MNKSENINELSMALSKAQGEMRGAEKDAKNPFFNSTYTTLTSVWDAIREPFAKNGLAVIQVICPDPNLAIIETVLSHSSGQWISSVISLPPGYINKQGEFVVERDAQAFGSCYTYARRFALAAITGVCPADDDGNASVGKKYTKAPDKKYQKLDESCEVLPPVEPKGKFSPEEMEKRLEDKKIDEEVQQDPEESECPAKWQDVVCHVKSTVQGKKLGDLSNEQLEKMYNTYQPKPPYKPADVWLKNGLVAWKKEQP